MQSFKFLFFIFLISCSQKKEIILIKQWHPAGNIQTTNIEKSMDLPQSLNQREIYEYLKAKIQKKEVDTLLVEGCEGEITKDFNSSFYGWSMTSLESSLEIPHYNKILAHIGMKLETEFPELKTFCGDNLKHLKEHSLRFSNARAFIGYLKRLEKFKRKGDIKSFNVYAKAMLNGKKEEPIAFAKKKLKETLGDINKYFDLRNISFVNSLKSIKSPKIALVIGGHHVNSLVKMLKEIGLKTDVYIPTGYPQGELNFSKEIEALLK